MLNGDGPPCWLKMEASSADAESGKCRDQGREARGNRPSRSFQSWEWDRARPTTAAAASSLGRRCDCQGIGEAATHDPRVLYTNEERAARRHRLSRRAPRRTRETHSRHRVGSGLSSRRIGPRGGLAASARRNGGDRQTMALAPIASRRTARRGSAAQRAGVIGASPTGTARILRHPHKPDDTLDKLIRKTRALRRHVGRHGLHGRRSRRVERVNVNTKYEVRARSTGAQKLS